MADGNPRMAISEGLNLDSKPIVVRVGPYAKQFYIHADLICAQSPFFQAALSHDWKESREQTVTLPEDDPRAFDLYLTWLHKRQIASKAPAEDDPTRAQEFGLLANSITLGEKLQDVRFKNALIDTLIAATEEPDKKGLFWFPTSRVVRDIYEGTPPNAPVRRLLVDMWVWHVAHKWRTPDREEDDFHKTFLLDLVAKFLEQRVKPSNGMPCTFGNRFLYHENEVQGSTRNKEPQHEQKFESQDGSAIDNKK